MMDKVETRAVIRYLLLKEKSPTETHQKFTTIYKDKAPSYGIVKHWHRHFRCGRTSVESELIPGRLHSFADEGTIEKMEPLVMEDRMISVRQLAEEVKISVGSVEKILHDHLQLRKVCARWIPRILSSFQKADRQQKCEYLLYLYYNNDELFVCHLITQDKT